MELAESQSLDSCQTSSRNDSHRMVVVTIRRGEERGICSAALKELLTNVKDQIEERCVVVIVVNKESAIWKDASTETLSRDDPLNYIDVEGMRVVTDNRCVAEQIKSDKVVNVATGGIKMEEFGKVGKRENLKSIVMDGVKIGTVGKSKNCQTVEERKDQDEEKLCKSIIHGFARSNREKHGILAGTGEEEQHVI